MTCSVAEGIIRDIGLGGLGIAGKTLTWIEHFLRERSVLGPLLFICYTHDLPDLFHTDIKIFADNTKLFADVSL